MNTVFNEVFDEQIPIDPARDHFRTNDTSWRIPAAVKVNSVALATFVLVRLQGAHWFFSCSAALITASITLLSEKFIRRDNGRPISPNAHQNSPPMYHEWFDLNTENIRSSALPLLVMGIFVQAIAGVVFTATGNPAGYAMAQSLKADYRLIFVNALVVPICQGILFRGFLQERMEDTCYLLSKRIRSFTNSRQKTISSFAQVILTSYILSYGQGTKITLGSITFNGFLEAYRDNTPFTTSIALHICINSLYTLRLLIFGQ